MKSIRQSSRTDRLEVYQQLSIRLIRAVAGFDPQKGKLKQHIFAQLRFELLNCKRPYRMFGMTGLPADYRGKKIISIEDYLERHSGAEPDGFFLSA